MDVMQELNALSIRKPAQPQPLSKEVRADMISDLMMEDIPAHKLYYLSDGELRYVYHSYYRVEEPV